MLGNLKFWESFPCIHKEPVWLCGPHLKVSHLPPTHQCPSVAEAVKDIGAHHYGKSSRRAGNTGVSLWKHPCQPVVGVLLEPLTHCCPRDLHLQCIGIQSWTHWMPFYFSQPQWRTARFQKSYKERRTFRPGLPSRFQWQLSLPPSALLGCLTALFFCIWWPKFLSLSCAISGWPQYRRRGGKFRLIGIDLWEVSLEKNWVFLRGYPGNSQKLTGKI